MRRAGDVFHRSVFPRRNASSARCMTLEIVVELQSSCETVKGARVPQKHTMTAAAVVLMVVES